MKMKDYMLYMVEAYINNEITFIYEEIENCKINKNRQNELISLQKDLKKLESLKIDDFIKISHLVFDEELQEKIYENINYYIYHYKGGANNE